MECCRLPGAITTAWSKRSRKPVGQARNGTWAIKRKALGRVEIGRMTDNAWDVRGRLGLSYGHRGDKRRVQWRVFLMGRKVVYAWGVHGSILWCCEYAWVRVSAGGTYRWLLVERHETIQGELSVHALEELGVNQSRLWMAHAEMPIAWSNSGCRPLRLEQWRRERLAGRSQIEAWASRG